jgi:hypothetical protein
LFGKSSQEAQVDSRANSANRIIEEYLKQRGVRIRRALIAFPQGYVLLEGSTELCRHNKERDCFEAVEDKREELRNKRKRIQAIDLFAGAGGTSTGLIQACEEAGYRVGYKEQCRKVAQNGFKANGDRA